MADRPPDADLLLAQLLAIADPARRFELLELESAGDAALRAKLLAKLDAEGDVRSPREVATLSLASDAGLPAGSFEVTVVSEAVGNIPATTPPGSAAGMVAGRYRLARQIGEGGMGAVWLAEQVEPVRRRVALKLIRADRGLSEAILARFEAERQAVALMDHPNIAKLFDAGTTASGSPFFVMELVEGLPLTDYCNTNRLDLPRRLRLFAKVCGAVSHAHMKGVIHRDLKPSNVLVIEGDDGPLPKVIDFGLAKAVSGGELADLAGTTGFGSVLGTPLYMAPEQASLSGGVDTRADVYSLGVILFELLTGTTPITREVARRAALHEVIRMVAESDSPTPSSRLGSPRVAALAAVERSTDPAKIVRLVRGDLDWVTSKALARDPDLRYESAGGLARDVARFLAGEPVSAGPPGLSYRLRKFARRRRKLVAATALAAAVFPAVAIAASVALYQVSRARDAEVRERGEAQDAAARARESEAKAIAARQEAERYAKQASHAIETLTSIGIDESRNDLEVIRQSILEEALAFFESVEAAPGAAIHEQVTSSRKKLNAASDKLAALFQAHRFAILVDDRVLDELGIYDVLIRFELDAASRHIRPSPGEGGGIAERVARTRERVDQLLTPSQLVRFKELGIQFEKQRAFRDPHVLRALGVDRDIVRLRQIREILADRRPAIPNGPSSTDEGGPPRGVGPEDESREDGRGPQVGKKAKFGPKGPGEIPGGRPDAGSLARILAVLTPGQFERWTRLVGRPFDFERESGAAPRPAD